MQRKVSDAQSLFLVIISQNLPRKKDKSSIILGLEVKIKIAKRCILLTESVKIQHFIGNLANLYICLAKEDMIIDMSLFIKRFT